MVCFALENSLCATASAPYMTLRLPLMLVVSDFLKMPMIITIIDLYFHWPAMGLLKMSFSLNKGKGKLSPAGHNTLSGGQKCP